MTVKVLRKVGLAAAAKTLERHRAKRTGWQRITRICHDSGQTTYWDKTWVTELACRSWRLMPRTGRIIVSQVEDELRRANTFSISRLELVERLNDRVAEMGLADAVPVDV